MHSRRFNALRQRQRTNFCNRRGSRASELKKFISSALCQKPSNLLQTSLQPYEPQRISPLTDPAEPVLLKTKRSGVSHSKGSGWSYAKKPSIAAASILGTITLFAIVYLVIWYVKGERGRRLRELQNASQDPFCQSTLTLTEDTSKTLDDFLMKEVQPERTSLMFSRSRSPSFTFVVDESDRQSPMNRLYPTTSGDTSLNSLTGLNSPSTLNSLSKTNSLTRISTDASRPSVVVSDLTQTTPNVFQKPASRISTSSTVVPSQRSSALWTTTTSSSTDSSAKSTVLSPVFSQREPESSITSGSQSASRSVHTVSSPAGSLTRSGPSTASRASSRYAGQRALDNTATIRRAQTGSHRRSLSTIHSPMGMELSASTSGQSTQSTQSTQPSTSTDSTTSPLLFRLSDG